MAEYIKTIGIVEPSYVIRKFLDWHQLPNLTDYLEAVHVQGLATSEHTTLLLKCYARMHKQEKLREFVRNEGCALKFDVTTAITVLRECGFIEEAKELAFRTHHHMDYIRLLIRDTKEYEAAVDYLHTLAFTEVDMLLQEEGQALLEYAGESTTDLLIDLCTGYTPCPTMMNEPTSLRTMPDLGTSRSMSASSSVLLRANGGELAAMKKDMEMVRQTAPATLRESLHESILSRSQNYDPEQISTAAPALLASLGTKVLEPVFGNPSTYVHLFASHTKLLKRFLEKVVEREKVCDCPTWNALLELLLRQERERREQGEIIPESESEVMKILQNPRANYDKEEALILVQTYHHLEGELFLYEENAMYSLLLQQYLKSNNSQAAIVLCKKHGEKKNALWIQLIMIIAKQNPVNEEFLTEILDYIEKSEVLPLLYVLQVLCENGHLQLKIVRKYIVHFMQKLKGLTEMVCDVT